MSRRAKKKGDLAIREFLLRRLTWKRAELDLKIGEIIELTAVIAAIEEAVEIELRVRRGNSIHQAAVRTRERPVFTDNDLPANFGKLS